MLEILDICGPSPKQWDMVIRGIRNPFKGQSDGDSTFSEASDERFRSKKGRGGTNWYYSKALSGGVNQTFCPVQEEPDGYRLIAFDGDFVFGKKDLKLATDLANAGPDHGKFLRELPVIIECRAPLYWWKQLDAYRVGVPAMNSESTMHTIQKKKFDLSDFSYTDGDVEHFLKGAITQLNRLRDEYLELDRYQKEFEAGDRSNWPIFMWDWEEETVDETLRMTDEELVDLVKELKMETWMSMIEMLPESYYQTRTLITSYAGLRNMYGQRFVNPHKLSEWRQMFYQLQPVLPFFDEFIIGNQYEKKENDKMIFMLRGYGETDPKEFWEKIKNNKAIKLENNDGEE